MGYEKVLVKIDKKSGKLVLEGDGFIGNRCDVLEQVESQLGTITKTESKAERYQFEQPEYLPAQTGG